MAFSNLGFETEDAAATGFPDIWTVSLAAASEEAAGFDDGQVTPPDSPNPVEKFEGGWSTNQSYIFAFQDPIDVLELEAGIFDAEGVEDFEEQWSTNESYSFAMGSVGAANFDANVFVKASVEPYVMALGDQFSITTDAGGPVLSTALTGTRGRLTAQNVVQNVGYSGRQIRIYYNGRGSLLVTFTGTEVDGIGISSTINTQAATAGISDQLTAGLDLILGVYYLYVESKIEGYESSIHIVNETPSDDVAGDIGYVPSQVGDPNTAGAGAYGTGNVALIDAVKAQDLEAVINGDAALGAIGAGATVTVDGALRLEPQAGGWINVANGTGTPATELAPWTDTTGAAYTPGTQEGPAALTTEPVEDLEEGWLLNEAFLFDWAGVVAGPGSNVAIFDAEAFEDFEEQWSANETYSFTMGSATAAVFDTGTGGASEAVEDFEEVDVLQVFTVDPATDTFTAAAHGMSNDQIVTFENSGGQLPAGLNTGTDYYLINVTANTFQVAPVSAGSAVDVTDTGTGTQRVRPDVRTFWTTQMVTL